MAFKVDERIQASGKTKIRFKDGNKVVYRFYSKLISASEAVSLALSLDSTHGNKVKKEKQVDTEFGRIKKSKEKDLRDYIRTIIQPLIEAKRNELNV